MADKKSTGIPGDKGVSTALSLFCFWENNKKMIGFAIKFTGALVASLVGLFVISFIVDAIYGSATAPVAPSEPAAEHAAAAPEPVSHDAAKPAEHAAAAASAPTPAPTAKPVVNLKKHPGRKAYLRKGSCAACHGRNGRRAISYYPTIAGQDKKYIIQQIKDIMAGKRKGSVESGTGHPRAEAMHGALVTSDGGMRITGEDIGQIADWLTQLKAAKPRTPETPLDADSVKAGKKLFKKCIACHGKQGKKPKKGYPYLAGQKRIYLDAQIKDIRDKARTSGKVKIMFGFVKRLTDEQIGAIADYLSQVDRTAK